MSRPSAYIFFFCWGLQRRAETGSEVLMGDLRATELRKKLLGIDVESPYTWLQCTLLY